MPDATGPPLLDDSDSHLLNDFFSNPDSFDATSSLLLPSGQAKGEPISGNSWAYTVPANYKSANTSLAVPTSSDQSSTVNNQYTALSNSAVNKPATDDVLGAASTLFSSFQTGNSQQIIDNARTAYGDTAPFGLIPPAGSSTANYNLTSPAHGQQQSPSFKSSSAVLPLNHQPQIRFGPAAPSRSGPSVSGHTADFRKFYKFGSDGNFGSNGYNLPMRQETEEEITKRLFNDMTVLRHVPVAKMQPSNARIESRPDIGVNMSCAGYTESSEQHRSEPYSSPAKVEIAKRRRKAKSGSPEQESEERESEERHEKGESSDRRDSKQTSPSKATKSRKFSQEDSTAFSTKRRKSQVAGQKQARENLTEEQKRNNHILSEQKRRNLIKQGFDDLHILVPELRSGNFSKSNVLVEAAVFLENLVKGNEELAAKLQGV